jgi:hypothetical protein
MTLNLLKVDHMGIIYTSHFMTILIFGFLSYKFLSKFNESFMGFASSCIGAGMATKGVNIFLDQYDVAMGLEDPTLTDIPKSNND